MTIHVNIGEGKTRFSELVRVASAGERVIVSRNGEPQIEMIPARSGVRLTREQIAARRRAAFGMFRSDYTGFDTSIEALKAERGDRDEKLAGSLGAAD